MKTKITVNITVEREGSPAETFQGTTPACLTLDADKKVFAATVTTLEGVLSQMHRRYLPTVEEAMEHNASQQPDAEPPKADGEMRGYV